MSAAFRRRKLSRRRFGWGQELVGVSGVSEAMGSLLAEALNSCSDFRTLDAHAREAWRRAHGRAPQLEREARHLALLRGVGDPGVGADAVEAAFESLAQVGFFFRRSDLTACESVDAGVEPTEISLLARGDDETLAAALRRNAGPLTVYDSGDGLESQRRATAGRFGATFIGRRERETLATKLIAAGADAQATVAALLGWDDAAAGCAPARNAALLARAGSAALLFNEEALLSFSSPEGSAEGLALSAGLGRRRWLFAQAPTRAAGSPLEAFAGMLGRPARLLAAQASEEENLDVEAAGDVWCGGDGRERVALISAGALGRGWLSARDALFCGRSTRATLFCDAEALSTALDGGFACAWVERRTVQSRLWTRGHAFALDLRRLPPPFLPSAAGSRSLFLRLLGALQPDAVGAEAPWLAQAPAAPTEGIFALADLFSELLEVETARGTSPEGSLVLLAEAVAALAAASETEYRRWARNVRWNILRDRIQALEALRAETEAQAPVRWKACARAYAEGLRLSLVDPFLLAPVETREADAERATSRGQVLLQRAADFMRAWPSVWSAALKLNGF